MWKPLRLSAALILVVACWGSPAAAQSQVKKMKPVPFGINSFGAATIGADIYVYGGHTGRAHSYSIDGVSGKLLRLDTSGKSDWEVVSRGPILQGLALVSHNGKLYRVGGLTVKKAAGAADEPAGNKSERELDTEAGETEFASGVTLKSLASVACFDPKTKEWTNLPDLPEPRSSHDAVVVGGTLFVVGGWMLDGAEGEEEWSETVYKLDLNAKSPAWKKFTPPKAPRRAHSLAALDGKLFLIGGMNDDGEVLNHVAVYDIAADKWSDASPIPSKDKFASFGNSAFTVGGAVYCMGIDGALRSIDSPKAQWKTLAQTQRRFFHRVVNLKGSVGIIGGSNMESGFTNDTLVFATSSAQMAKPAGRMTSLKQTLGQLKSVTPKEYPAMIAKIADAQDDRDFLLKAIRSGVAPQPNEQRTSKLKKGWSEWEATDESGQTRPYQIYLPESVAKGKKPAALIVHIHGAVGKPDFGRGAGNPSAIGYAGFLWPKVADANDYVIACPVGRNECAWWTDNGVSHINAVIRDVRRSISVPDRSIFGSGFSDGGSGCYYLSMAAPGQFAGFYAMNGHPRVASSASDKQLYLQNMTATPLIAGMTQEDSLYPSKNVLPHITAAIAQGAPLTVISYPNVNHQPLYFDDQIETLVKFIGKTKRADDRSRVRWSTSDARIGAIAWAEIQEIGSTVVDAPAMDEVNVMSRPGRVSIGVQLASDASVAEVVDGSAAAASGLKAGDKLVSFEGTKFTTSRALQGLLRSKTYGDKFTLTVNRGGKEMEVTGRFPTFKAKPIYRRENPTAFIDCSIDIEGNTIALTSRNVKRLRVWLPDELAANKTVKLTQGDKTGELPVRRLATRDLIERFAKRADAFDRMAYVEIESQ